MDISYQFHVPAALPPGKEPLISTDWEAGKGEYVLPGIKQHFFVLLLVAYTPH
jgi:hypothetical protein